MRLQLPLKQLQPGLRQLSLQPRRLERQRARAERVADIVERGGEGGPPMTDTRTITASRRDTE